MPWRVPPSHRSLEDLVGAAAVRLTANRAVLIVRPVNSGKVTAYATREVGAGDEDYFWVTLMPVEIGAAN